MSAIISSLQHNNELLKCIEEKWEKNIKNYKEMIMRELLSQIIACFLVVLYVDFRVLWNFCKRE